jgi:TonB family protein
MNLHEAAAGILSYALQSGLLLAIGLLLPKALRLRHPATLLGYWRVLLIAVLLLPLALTGWQQKTQVAALTIEGITVEAVVTATLPEQVPGFTWPIVFVLIAIGALLGLVRLAIGLVYLRRCRGGAEPLRPEPLSVSKVQKRLGTSAVFLVSNRLSAPITFGWRRPTVLVPLAFRDLTAEEQEGVACHELLHVKRGDWAMTFLEEVMRAVLWFHPAIWLLLPRIALSREQVVDAGAVRLTGKRRQYLDALWQIVCTYRRQAEVLAVPFLGRSHLFERVALLKKEIAMSKARIVLSGVILVVALMTAGFFGAAIFPSTSQAAVNASLALSPESAPVTEKDTAKDGELKLLEGGECGEITHPEAINKVNPRYPEEARKAGLSGVVVLETTITEEGKVTGIEVLRSADEMLSEAAVEAVKHWEFKPALCDGKPVGVYYVLTIKFHLK